MSARHPGFGVPALAAAAAIAVAVPGGWAVWGNPGHLFRSVHLESGAARPAAWQVQLGLLDGFTGAWGPARWAALAGVIIGLVALAVVGLVLRAPRTRPAPRLGGAVLAMLVTLGVSALLSRSLSGLSDSVWFAPVLFPIALLAVPAAALCSTRYAVALSICLAVGAAAGVGLSGGAFAVPLPDLIMAVAVAAGGLAAAAAGGRATHPAQLVTGGLLVGGAQSLGMVAAMTLVLAPDRLPNFGELGGVLGLGVAMGAAQGVALRALMPVFERISGRMSAVSLARWSDPAHPLLVRLKREAPGTFHHSQAVGALAATAAAEVGADPAIARVGGLYHDIGKIRRPDAFGENTPDTCHRDLRPGESASLILAHVRDGAELAREYTVPAVIAGFIVEHHGTTTVEYFYNKAKEEAVQRGEKPPRRADYTYAGPRPQTVESALVMLADSAEASSRSLENPSVAEIRDIVEKIYRNKFGGFQFDECDVTNRQLAEAREIFVKELAASRHTRPEYPDTEYPTQAISKAAVQAAKAEA